MIFGYPKYTTTWRVEAKLRDGRLLQRTYQDEPSAYKRACRIRDRHHSEYIRIVEVAVTETTTADFHLFASDR